VACQLGISYIYEIVLIPLRESSVGASSLGSVSLEPE